MAILVKDVPLNLVEPPSDAAIVPSPQIGNSTITPNLSNSLPEPGSGLPFAEENMTQDPVYESPIEDQEETAIKEQGSHIPPSGAKTTEVPVDRSEYRRKINKKLKKTLRENNNR